MAFAEYDMIRVHRERVGERGNPNRGQSVSDEAVRDLDSINRTPEPITSYEDYRVPANDTIVTGGRGGTAPVDTGDGT